MSRRKKIEESIKNKDKIRKENWDKNMEAASKAAGEAWDSLVDLLTPKKKKPGEVKLNKKKVKKFKRGL